MTPEAIKASQPIIEIIACVILSGMTWYFMYKLLKD